MTTFTAALNNLADCIDIAARITLAEAAFDRAEAATNDDDECEALAEAVALADRDGFPADFAKEIDQRCEVLRAFCRPLWEACIEAVPAYFWA